MRIAPAEMLSALSGPLVNSSDVEGKVGVEDVFVSMAVVAERLALLRVSAPEPCVPTSAIVKLVGAPLSRCLLVGR